MSYAVEIGNKTVYWLLVICHERKNSQIVSYIAQDFGYFGRG